MDSAAFCWALFHLPMELSLSEKLPPPCLFCSCACQVSLAVRYLGDDRQAHDGSERAPLYRPGVGGVRENGGTNALRALLAVPGRWGGPSSSSLDDCESDEMFIVESCLGCETTVNVTSIGQGRGPFLLSIRGRVLPGNSSTEWIPSDDFEYMASIGH